MIDIYNMCSGAREGMSGSINYSVLLDVAKSKGLTNFEDLLYLTKEIESKLRDKKKKAKK